MKKIKLLFLALLTGFILQAQMANPVSWNFVSKKINDNTYQIQMIANIQNGWHLYSQVQPEDAIAIPTTFTINSNPLIKLEGKIKELGKMEKFTDKKLGLSANQYSKKVVFMQEVKLKGKIKTNFTGTVEFQTCDDEKCLPPKTVNFNIALN